MKTSETSAIAVNIEGTLVFVFPYECYNEQIDKLCMAWDYDGGHDGCSVDYIQSKPVDPTSDEVKHLARLYSNHYDTEVVFLNKVDLEEAKEKRRAYYLAS